MSKVISNFSQMVVIKKGIVNKDKKPLKYKNVTKFVQLKVINFDLGLITSHRRKFKIEK